MRIKLSISDSSALLGTLSSDSWLTVFFMPSTSPVFLAHTGLQ